MSKMDPTTAKAIKEDFLVWSGGFPPDSNEQIFAYVEAARPADTDEVEVDILLKDWMREEQETENWHGARDLLGR